MRDKFEKLEHIAKKLKMYKWFYSHTFKCYVIEGDDAGFINSAWYAFQEQQKKIDEVKTHIERIENFNSKVDAGYDPEFVAGFIDAFIDSADAVLK